MGSDAILIEYPMVDGHVVESESGKEKGKGLIAYLKTTWQRTLRD